MNKLIDLICMIIVVCTNVVNAYLDYSMYSLLRKELNLSTNENIIQFYEDMIDENTDYLYFAESERLRLKDLAKEMFEFGYDNYMRHAYPLDELDPIHCTGRGPDVLHPENININDVLGDYMLTLVDSLDSLVILGNSSEFKRAVRLVINNLHFDKDSTVQVFEATIRVLGSLLSAHLIITDSKQPFGDMTIPEYENELLHLAHDLATRLLQAFSDTTTDIPYPRVNLKTGLPVNMYNYTCTSGAGSLLLEFGMLSRLLGDSIYEKVARNAINYLYSKRDNVTGLFGNEIHVQTGTWAGICAGLGAGMDSYYEYLLKSFILFGDKNDYAMFDEVYNTLKVQLRKGRKECNSGVGHHPIYVNVNMKTGAILNNWIDSLQASYAGVQVLNGDLDEAICFHALYYAIWQKFDVLPERYNWNSKMPDVFFYPLRPEFAESTYFLYQATKSPFYLHVAKDIIENLNNLTRVKCGFATVHDVTDKSLEDRMESFFLSETMKYLYLTFDKDHYLNNEGSMNYLFTTEGHLFPIRQKYQTKFYKTQYVPNYELDRVNEQNNYNNEARTQFNSANANCNLTMNSKDYLNLAKDLPLKIQYLDQVFEMVGVEDDIETLLQRKIG